MGMSTRVEGFKARDKKWEKMEKVWVACTDAGIDLPEEVEDFFEGVNPVGEPGQSVSIDECVSEWGADMSQGYQVEIAKIPKDITHIRFSNSW